MKWVKRLQLKGHPVDPNLLWAVQWVLGVLGIFWALLIGVFVSCGGAEHLTGSLYQPLMETFHDYHVIGAVNIIGGIFGLLGFALDRRGLSIASAITCAMWNGLLAFYLIPANWTVPGGGNVLGLYAAFVMLIYLMRIVLLVAHPGRDAVKLR